MFVKNWFPFLDTYLYSIGTHYGNLLKSLVNMSRVACFIPWVLTGNCISCHTKCRERIWKNEGEWTWNSGR